MSDRMRWRYGDTNPVVAAVDAETAIEIGDQVWQDIDDAKPASVLPVPGVGAHQAETLQELFADKFLGVALQRSLLGQTDTIRVATTGVFDFDCPRDTFELGNLVGANMNAAGTALLNQQVAKVTASKYAVGRVCKRVSPAATTALVEIRSTVMTGGVKGSIPSGV